MKVGIGSDIQAYIFFLYFVRENRQSAQWFSDWNMSECFLSAPYHLLSESHRLTQPWPLPPVRGSPGREGVTDPTLPSQWEVLKAWQVWVTCLAVGWSEPAVERKQVFLGPIFCLPLWTLLLSSCSQRRSLMPFLLDSSLLIQCTKKWDITTNH